MIKLYSRFPKAAIFYVLRNPIMRAYSARRFTVTRGKKGPDFLEPERVASLFTERASLPRGEYADNIRRWRKVAETHELPPPHIVFYDDILSGPVGFLQKLCRMIGIDADFYGQIPEQVLAERVNSAHATAFPAEVYPQALSHYRPMILELQDLTGEDLWGWLNEDAPSEHRQPLPDKTHRAAALANAALLRQEIQLNYCGPRGPRVGISTFFGIGSRPSRCSFLRCSLRARRTASAFSRAFFSEGFS